ncbi:MAG TPA: helix-turn-helix domain-containing protein [Desulfobacteraceae bacterium]|nr:helix-turn-helix domain-containing protein [Desulfobacteraceae bacterium]
MMEYQTITENGKVKFVVLPVEEFNKIMERLRDESDLRDIHKAASDLLYDQDEAETYIFMNPVKRERLDKGWTQDELADRIGVKQSTVAKWERQGAVYRKATRKKLVKVFGIKEESFT